jgi:hypothetical protein
MAPLPLPPPSALEHLEKVLGSEVFRTAGRSQRLLRFLVEQTVNGQAERLKEYTIGSEALGRGESFDPRIDSIARVEVSRLRTRLEQYYATEGKIDSLMIVLPKGSYVPRFERRDTAIIPPKRRRPAPWLILAFLGGAATAAFVFLVMRWQQSARQPTANQPLLRLEVELRSGGRLASLVGTDVVMSPDGSRIVFVAIDSDGVSHLYTRLLSQANVSELAGTDGARGPFFSRNGEWVGYWAQSKVWKTPIAGGSPILLCDAPDLLGASWGEDGDIAAALSSDHKLCLVPAEGGAPKAIPGLPPTSDRLLWPQMLPDSRAVLYTIVPSGADAGSIAVFSFRDRVQRTLIRGGTFGRYLPGGYLTYINQGTLYAVPFDLDGLRIRDTPVAVLTDVAYSPTHGFAQFDFSQTGILVYRRTTGRGQVVVQWIDKTGKTTPILSRPGQYFWPALSPDGNRLALETNDGGKPKVVVFDLKTGKLVPINSESQSQMSPAWTPDGQYLVIGREQLEWVRSDGFGALETGSVRRQQPPGSLVVRSGWQKVGLLRHEHCYALRSVDHAGRFCGG